MLSTIVHIFYFIIGLLFLYLAIFIYEDDQKRIQNKLSDWYLNILIIKEQYSTIKSLIIKANELILEFFTRHFDNGRVTLKFIGSCGLLYACAMLMFAGFIPYLSPVFTVGLVASSPIRFEFFIYGLFLIWIILLTNKVNQKYPVYFFIYLLLLFCFFYQDLESLDWMYLLLSIGYMSISFAFIKINIRIIKWNLKKLTTGSGFLLIIPSFLFNIILVVVVLFVAGDLEMRINNVGIVSLMLIPPTLILVFLFHSSFIFLLFMIVINKLVWPILHGPIRAIYEHKIIRNKKLLTAIGFLFLALSNNSIVNAPFVRTIKDLFK